MGNFYTSTTKSASQYIFDDGGCFSTINSVNQQLIQSLTISRSSVNSLDFKGKNARRETLPQNAFSYFRHQIDYPVGAWSAYAVKFCNGKIIPTTRSYNGALSGALDWATPPNVNTFSAARTTSLANKSTKDLLLKIKDQRVNLGQVVAERSQVVRMFTSTVKNVSSALVHLKQGNLLGASSALGVTVSKRKHSGFKSALVRSRIRQAGGKVPASLSVHTRQFDRSSVDECLSAGWLSLQYGWLPLLSDVQGGLETLYESQHRPDERSVSSKRCGDFLEQKLWWSSGQYNGLDEWKNIMHTQSRARFRATSKYLSDAAPLGLLNPMAIAWEILPWSFVIDWFIPIGNYVNSLDATAGLQFVDGSQTTFERRTASRSVSGRKWQGITYVGSWGCRREQISCERVKFLTFPSATMPEFKSPISFVHFANAVSLLIQLRK